MNQQNILSIIVRNRSGVLTKIAGMFYRRDCNIETLTVGKTHFEGLSKIVITVPMDPDDLELLRRQIENLVDVYEVRLLDSHRSIQMEMCLIRIVHRSLSQRLEIMASANPYRPRIRGTADGTVTLEVAERPEIIDDFVAVMSRYEIEGISRTGMTALGPSAPPMQDRGGLGDDAHVHHLDDRPKGTTTHIGARP